MDSGNNSAEYPTGSTQPLIRFEELDQIVKERAAWARSCMPGLWDRFITILEAKTFTLDEITREHKRIRNFHGSVDEHRKAFMEAVESWFECGLDSSEEPD